jgi:hypothetical protein
LTLPFRQSQAALVAGTYAWVVTVALPLSHRGSPGAARLAAAVAFALLLGGVVASPRYSWLGTGLGVWGFVAACALAWGIGRAQLLGYRLDPVQGGLGTIGWAAYVASWAMAPRARPAPLPGVPVRKPRARPNSSAIVIAAVGCFAAFGLLLLAWWIPDRARGVVGQGVAVAGAAYVSVLVFRLACDRAAPAGDRTRGGTSLRRALARARWPLAVVLTVAVLGAVAAWLR